ncbi:hypothetical protein N7454_005634 [Penicillium verhagenii]|nr:hypothetical protein N7454_005634 [Penicillium verhagenii]
MARTTYVVTTPQVQWITKWYQDHANQPAILMTFGLNGSTDPESMLPLPEIAIQVYSTVPLDLNSKHEYTALGQYLGSQMLDSPRLSFEIYGPQPDVFTCVEHQRREILHRKNNFPGEGFFPGIAKVALNDQNRLLQGFLLVITSYSFRTTDSPEYEAESGPLWVTFNRSFPLKAQVDLHSRIEGVSPFKFDPSKFHGECEVYSEREELVVRKCRNLFHILRELSSLLKSSECGDMDYQFDYGLDEDEGDPSFTDQPPEIITSLQRKADSLQHEDFNIQSPSQGAVVITSIPSITAPEPDLRYIIHIAFPYKQLGLDLMPIAKAFTALIIENLPRGKTVSFEFLSAPQSLGAILTSHRNLLNSRPEIAVGAAHQSRRIFPQDRSANYIPGDREPYRTFFVIVDRPDFLTGPGVLFFLTDGNDITDEALQNISRISGVKEERGNYKLYQVWRSVGMAQVARRLAMIPPHVPS